MIWGKAIICQSICFSYFLNQFVHSNIPSSRMSIDSPVLSEAMALSVLGNAIAPEQKPRVPTMSERDVTRRQTSNFTRNRIFLS